MGSGVSRHLALPACLRPSADGDGGNGFDLGPLDEALGHSFCYVRSSCADEQPCSSAAETAFRAISGASVSANSSAPVPLFSDAAAGPAPGFRSSASFSALPLQLSSASGPLDRSFFLSGPIERGAHSGPLDAAALAFSGPLARKPRRKRGRSFSGGLKGASLLRRSFSERNRPWVVPLRGPPPATRHVPDAGAGGRVEWAHGKAGEDRAHVVVWEDHRWLFVGIYDGFNGPDAPEFLLSHLYLSVHDQLRGLFWEETDEGEAAEEEHTGALQKEGPKVGRRLWEFLAEAEDDAELSFSSSGRFAFSMTRLKHGLGSWRKDSGGRIWFPRWHYDAKEKAQIIQEVSSTCGKRRRKMGPVADHALVLGALSRALETTEAAYLEMTDRAMDCNPELALMGSCLLVVLMRDDDVYVMNVGDSRAIVAQYRPLGMDSAGGNVECMEGEGSVGGGVMELGALQLSIDHSTSIEEEVLRIRKEHPDDDQCIVNDRVKGRLKVTRAFGAGFLKQPRWNNALLEMFRNNYVGTAPYISCVPFLCHHKLGPNDQFLILSSDGLYQYLSNEEVVLHVGNFMDKFPDGDPAQSLIEELLFRAAKKAGMNFHELLDIPQGDRRKYHDDVTVMVISLEGRIWKSSGKYL